MIVDIMYFNKAFQQNLTADLILVRAILKYVCSAKYQWHIIYCFLCFKFDLPNAWHCLSGMEIHQFGILEIGFDITVFLLNTPCSAYSTFFPFTTVINMKS